MSVGAITALVRALPRPDRLREFHISVSNVSESNDPWHQLGFWDALSGLEELYVSGEWRWRDFDHSGDCAPPNWDAPLQEISPLLPDRREDDADSRVGKPTTLLISFLL
ncbi:hypothetical protein BS47DRAFT_1351853 [Hydnum rufescens UP504]|uniref:Uncharacterized protein n=1 Tax=Hydnum rufescens UP504 TaxID=1448309 RepID=A0A9P6AM01_9AGAM|nr:hypothetical protein BS47DRAFT_1351853 [Hydnum rufescens UP504]